MGADRSQIRCAIYTRKSTEEGLDQAFNSLDAQREACEAYIASQKAEGWKLIPTSYDDGGKSGGSLDRPALQRLLHDMRDGKIDLIVVYKIDRLTRSLTDFARLVDDFDGADCSFVSVTQSFNTSTSMGRLTLNVLLSFAQFEREVTAERIRDKFAASKRKGLWMGGLEPFGYTRHPDPKVQSLIPVGEEALIVKKLFELYDHHSCTSRVESEARGLGFKSRERSFGSGRNQGGTYFGRGYIHKILTNPIYIGKIRYREKLFDGLHDAIISEALWTRVQRKLSDGSGKRRGVQQSSPGSILAGKLVLENGERFTPSHANKNGRRYRYYVSSSLLKGKDEGNGWRLPASALEAYVSNEIRTFVLHNQYRLIEYADVGQAFHIVTQSITLSDNQAFDCLKGLQIKKGEVEFTLDPSVIASFLNIPVEAVSKRGCTFRAPFQLRRKGVEICILHQGVTTSPDKTLIKALAKACADLEEIKKGEMIIDIAKCEGTDKSNIRRRLPLAFLSPKITEKILAGEQPVELNLERLMATDLPMSWDQKWSLLGFDQLHP